MIPRLLVTQVGESVKPWYGRAGNATDTARCIREHTSIDKEACEVFIALLLDIRYRVLGWQEISRGSLAATLVHPREVFKAACVMNAACVIVAHNHPSGNPTPSAEDFAVSERLAKAGNILGIELLDHIVVCEHAHASAMRREGT